MLTVAAALLALAAPSAVAAPGDLDTTFSLDGMDVRDLGSGGGYRLGQRPTGSALDSKGRLLVLGPGFLARLRADGQLDPDFGRRGIVTTGPAALARSVGVDAQDRVYVAGQMTYGEWDVTRLTPLGEIDDSYGGGDGTVGGAFADRTLGAPLIAVEPSGRASIAAYCADPSAVAATCLARVTPDGLPAAAFSGDGQNVVELGENEAVTGVAVDTLGRLVLSGYSDTAAESNRPTLVRVTTGGVLDAGFGSGGIVRLTGIEGDQFAPLGVTTDAQNRVLVTGGNTATGDTVVRRFTTGGQPDTQFGDDGLLTDGFDDKADYGAAIDVDHAGRIVVGGTVTAIGFGGHTRANRFVARYSAGGEPDAAFGEEGVIEILGPAWAAATGLHVDGDGRPHADAGPVDPAVALDVAARADERGARGDAVLRLRLGPEPPPRAPPALPVDDEVVGLDGLVVHVQPAAVGCRLHREGGGHGPAVHAPAVHVPSASRVGECADLPHAEEEDPVDGVGGAGPVVVAAVRPQEPALGPGERRGQERAVQPRAQRRVAPRRPGELVVVPPAGQDAGADQEELVTGAPQDPPRDRRRIGPPGLLGVAAEDDDVAGAGVHQATHGRAPGPGVHRRAPVSRPGRHSRSRAAAPAGTRSTSGCRRRPPTG
jgi:uncharacterized delta-60 repeat protein